jgi:hypothetical protein
MKIKIIIPSFIIAALVAGQSDAALITDGFTFTDPATSAFTYGRYTAGLAPISYSLFTQKGDLGVTGDPNYTGSEYAGLKYKNDPGSVAARRRGGLPGGASASRTSGAGSGGASFRPQAGRSRQTSDVST